ncbi:MAG: Gfo/Idh/MocA family oxidoreductase [Clostridiales bacterium]|nr:Gfo/Idh/MocA family oxidoreductase [Clostridiales bacterium]
MKRVKTAVVGLRRGATLAKFALNYVKSIEIVAVCDLNRELADKFALENGIPAVYYELDEVLKTDVEAVILATPIPDHAEHTIKTLNAGKHLLCEVISATSIEDCQRIANACKANPSVRYMMEENYCWYRPLTIVQNMIKAGLFGDMYYGESDYLMDFQFRAGFPDSVQPWRRKTYFGRRGHPYITHTLGPLCYTLGSDIKTVTCLGAGSHPGVPADRTCVLLLQTHDGGMIRLRNSFMCTRPDLYTYYSVQGTKGCYQGSVGATDTHKVHIRGLCGSQEWRDVYDFRGLLPKEWDMYPKDFFDDSEDNGTTKYDSGTPLLLDAFAKSIISNTTPPVSAKRSLNWTAAGILSEMSINNSGQPVEIPDFGL